MALQRTSLILDTELVQRAASVLGTSTKTDTVRVALERAVREDSLRRLVGWELPDSAAQMLREQRRPRHD
jgi:Arc/MetJ family transcription regulator